MCATGALFKGHRMESLTNMYNEMHDTGDDGIEDAQKDDQLDKEKSEDEESFIGEESGEEESVCETMKEAYVWQAQHRPSMKIQLKNESET